MEKIKLDLSELSVDSFDPVDADTTMRGGTVRGYVTEQQCVTNDFYCNTHACPNSENPLFPSCGGTNFPLGCPKDTLEPCTYPVSICTGPPGETEVATCASVCASCEGMNTCWCGGGPTDGGEETCAQYVTCDGGAFC